MKYCHFSAFISFSASQCIDCMVIAKPDGNLRAHSSGKHNMCKYGFLHATYVWLCGFV